MSEAMQLTVDGSEVPFAATRRGPRPSRPLSERQQDIVAYARSRGGLIRPIQAGVIQHAPRPSHQRGVYRNLADIETRGIEPLRCCPWASKDGGEALKRLMARGLVERVGRGTYVLVGW